jgi:hypothetical protein
LRHGLAAEARAAGAEKDDVRGPADSRVAALFIAGMSSAFSGSRNNGSEPSSWRARSQASASALRARTSA